MKRSFIMFFTCLFFSYQGSSSIVVDKEPLTSISKGLFTIQFSWNKESFSNNIAVGVSYKKKAFLSKEKASGYNMSSVSKNGILSLELNDGEYELVSVNLTGKEIGYNKVLKVPLEETFTIVNGKVTNGGLIFIGKEQKGNTQVYSIRIDNTKDIQRFLAVHKKEYSNSLENIKPAYKFLPNEKLNKIIEAYVETLVAKENLKPRAKVKYLYTTLGIFIKMEKNKKGLVLSYKIIPTPTYQEIKKATKRSSTIVCTLGNDDFLYGNDLSLDYMKLPESLALRPDIYRFGKNQFLLVDNNFNIFSSDDSFKWKEQQEHSLKRAPTSYFFFPPVVYMGPKHIYIYNTGSSGNKRIFSATYTDLHFKKFNLSKDIKRVPFITETENKLIIGPVLKLTPKAKKPGYLFVKSHSSEGWKTITLPRGDCNRFGPDQKNDDIFHIECSKEKIPYTSQDNGNTWEKK